MDSKVAMKVVGGWKKPEIRDIFNGDISLFEEFTSIEMSKSRAEALGFLREKSPEALQKLLNQKRR